MARYRLNRIAMLPRYDHEVHKEGCVWWPTQNYVDLGDHPSCVMAVAAAKQHYSDAMDVRPAHLNVIEVE
jgi:hypothetical protein